MKDMLMWDQPSFKTPFSRKFSYFGKHSVCTFHLQEENCPSSKARVDAIWLLVIRNQPVYPPKKQSQLMVINFRVLMHQQATTQTVERRIFDQVQHRNLEKDNWDHVLWTHMQTQRRWSLYAEVTKAPTQRSPNQTPGKSSHSVLKASTLNAPFILQILDEHILRSRKLLERKEKADLSVYSTENRHGESTRRTHAQQLHTFTSWFFVANWTLHYHITS